MERYVVDVSDILHETAAEIHISDTMPLSELVVGDEAFAPLGPASLDLTLTNTGAGIVASGQVTLPVEAECARCLERFRTDISADVEGFYVSPEHQAGLPEEQDYEIIHESRVDLAPAILGALALEAPFAPLHDPECRGICPTCGRNRNDAPCACDEDSEDSGPFSGLGRALGAQTD